MSGSSGRQRLRRSERIARRSEILNILRRGKRFECGSFRIIYESNNGDRDRIAVLVSSRSGKAVQRNRIKRTFREIFRTSKQENAPFFDVVILPRCIDVCTCNEVKCKYLRWRQGLTIGSAGC